MRLIAATGLALAAVVAGTARPVDCTPNLAGMSSGAAFDVTALADRSGSARPLEVESCVAAACSVAVVTTGRLFHQAPLTGGAIEVSLTVRAQRKVVFHDVTTVTPVKHEPNGAGCDPLAWQAMLTATGAGDLDTVSSSPLPS